jgi:hypothetical protein
VRRSCLDAFVVEEVTEVLQDCKSLMVIENQALIENCEKTMLDPELKDPGCQSGAAGADAADTKEAAAPSAVELQDTIRKVSNPLRHSCIP